MESIFNLVNHSIHYKSVFIVTVDGVAWHNLECHTAITEWAFRSSNSTVAVKLERLKSTNTCHLWRIHLM